MDRVFGRPCSEILRGISSGNLQASTSVLVPIGVANALRRYGLAKDVAQQVRAIFSLGLEIYTLDRTDTLEAAEIYGTARVSPCGCLNASVMKMNGLSKITSADKEFEKIPWLKRLDPRVMGLRG